MTANGILYQDYAKLQYGRMLWKNADMRERLLRHWTDPRHPHAERFRRWRPEVEALLASPKGSDEQLDRDLRARGLSLRVVVREIPSVFGDFF
ncbi:MAG: hypothetical protein L0Y58_03620 [Verrucomicrobia subdivision 3 bacterium]|nr:hypothetical protein [Limisphaerales bacterium]